MKGEEAVSPVIGTMLMLAIFIGIGTSVYLVARPQLVEVQEQGAFDAVSQQMQSAMSDLKGLAVSGDTGAVKKPVLTLPDGAMRNEVGHYAAVSVAIQDDDYNDVVGQTYAQGAHRDFYVVDWDPTEAADETQIRIKNNGTTLAASAVFTPQWLSAGGLWVDETAVTYKESDAPAPFDKGDVMIVDFAKPLQESVYRVRITSNGVLAGEVYLYNQTRLVFEHEGETGQRRLYAESGAVWTYEKGRYFQRLTSIYAAPSVYSGTGQFTFRFIDLNTTGASGGGGKVSLIMHLVRETDFALNHGVSILRLQMVGAAPDVWENALETQGYKKETENSEAAGVYYIFAEYHDDTRKVFPFHMTQAQIDMRLRGG